ncbi:serine/threonine-protein kinase Sgk2 [Amniculicola lignicola CBS 123094]|uniref:Serine/threonine-protein kinase Sgk2 n=1 Tax=Amniculicola lignicola CBS 123094 TaxID=1392246 RepID=A0A6A5WCT5_9PLEO|nr:serine/threonine-protein kinase Sgk2 [Amniculicola lignicola CBS 123094]
MTDPSRSAIIKAKPIGHGLNAFRESAQSLSQELEISRLTAVLGRIGSEGIQDHALDLISALQILPASRLLPSGSGGKNLFSDLSRLNLAINAGDFDVGRVIPLLTAVFNNESDDIIWGKVYDAVAESISTAAVKPSTPPPSDPRPSASFQQTPWTFNTGSFADTSDLRKDVDPILKNEVEGNLRVDHPDVFTTFFRRIPRLHEMTTAVFQSCKDAEPPLFQGGVGWVDWPTGCEEAAVLRFLRRHTDQLLLYADEHDFHPAKRRRCITTPNKPVPGSVSKRKLDVGLAYNSNIELEDGDGQRYDWSHILIPGELKSNAREDNHSSTWLDLVRYAREIFSAQDTRRFVHGFTICGSMMRLWEFDRLGAIGSTAFDINKDGEMFVSAILGYLWMSEEELGFDPTIMENNGRYTDIQRNGQTERLYLGELMKRQRSVAGRATTCWRGSLEDKGDGRVVIKDSWEYEERPEEGLLLKEATEAGVENVARYYHHETVRVGGEMDDVLYNVRKGLSEAGGRNAFQQRRSMPSEPTTSSVIPSASSSKRGRSTSRSKTMTRKRSSSCLQPSMPPPKRSCSDSPVKQDAAQRRNRVHRRLVMRDIGKSIYEASSPQAILTGLLGGIKGHESLLEAKILHRDISIGNVVLNMAEDDGFLIDLDLAIKIDRENASGALSKTGTKVFMAIGALYGEDHNFMHDLESFFWVLFWVCVHWNGPGRSRSQTKYDSWNYEPTQKLAEIKKGKMDEEDKFMEEVEKEFTAQCRPLIPCIQELRKVVFPEGKRWLREDRELYSRMKSVLQQAKKDLDTIE